MQGIISWLWRQVMLIPTYIERAEMRRQIEQETYEFQLWAQQRPKRVQFVIQSIDDLERRAAPFDLAYGPYRDIVNAAVDAELARLRQHLEQS